MSYTYRQDPAARSGAPRVVVLAGVAALHLGVLYGLVTGLAGVVTLISAPPNLPTHNVPFIEPTTPPSPQPTTHPRVDARQPIPRDPNPLADPLPLPSPTVSASPGPIGDGGATLGPIGDVQPTPTPLPRLAVRPALPQGSPGDWMSADDYPSADLREGNAGVTGFRLTITSEGRVQDCTIIASSGHPRLDATTCQLVSRRARFRPATDDTGASMTGSYRGQVRWTIPER